MKRHIVLLLGVSLLVCSAKPVTKTKKDGTNAPESPDTDTVEYERYLREVVEALESDPEFRKKLDKAPEADIRNGKIAQELEYVNHRVRTKLHEIKRREVERLRSLANQKFELNNKIDRKHIKISEHLDHKNEHTFEIEDLEKLISKTAEDLAEIDRRRQEDFKQYELQKEFEKEMAMKELDEKQRKEFEEEQKAQREKHKKHEKVHHPGNKAQLEDVWEKVDQLDRKDFNPHTFFALHDIDGNKVWEAEEVEALFVKELDKVYRSGLPETDMRERAEEMERMREHFFQETDTNRDGLISFEEFMDRTRREEYNRDPGWETIDERPQFTHEEYLEYERNRLKEVEQMVAQGLLPPHPNMPQGYYPHNSNAAYQIGQQHPAVNQQQNQMHYENPQQQHMQQQKQYKQQQQQYQQHQQQQQYQQHQQHPIHTNEVYQQIPVQHQQPLQQQQQQYQQHQQHPIHTNEVYQKIPVQQHQQPLQQQYQPQPVVGSLPPQQQHQPIANNNNLTPQQPAASNLATQQQPVANNISPQQQPAVANNIPLQQQPINNAIPQQTNNNVQQENNIPQKH